MKIRLNSFTLLCVVFLAACLCLPQSALADPPKEVVLSYDKQMQTLTATITHKSAFTGWHYVKQVTVKKNQITVETKNFSSQKEKETFVYTFEVPAAENDVLEVTAACNLQGSKTATLKVE
jgi:desulfoferrodoxin (superoxide reductase-like protein)